ncbi:hypothetical protein RJ639_004184 [Escallonia herrerae]|uniref:Methyltransferase type 11 domain-containing protein n=1 Tax=Escallonia herrerae TaxID=1293975 RepID=A0AA89B2S7_9ASTE|nr:hypothetical protein RJ639_004184 [Escallonia herrerae]
MAPSRLGYTSRFCFFKRSLAPTTFKRSLAVKIRASTTAFVESSKPDSIVDDNKVNTRNTILACPICYEPLIWNGDAGLSVDSAPGSILKCFTCRKDYFGNETYLDLTVASGAKAYGEPRPVSTELFSVYLQFEMVKDYLQPVLGGNIVDASCGSGLFSRLFAKSGLFSLVVALDFSENMLKQCYEFIKQEQNFPIENISLVRADISRLPFASGSVDAVHAGAALHCWPTPSAAVSILKPKVAEISRVLRPGGVFVATTYILDGPFSFFPLLGPLRQNISQISGSHIFLSERELEDLCLTCGLVGFTRVRNRRFVMISASKLN